LLVSAKPSMVTISKHTHQPAQGWADLWCRVMHNSLMWPIHGQAQCRRCGRRRPVPWAQPGRSGHVDAIVHSTLRSESIFSKPLQPCQVIVVTSTVLDTPMGTTMQTRNEDPRQNGAAVEAFCWE
jgi:hypothetical protein